VRGHRRTKVVTRTKAITLAGTASDQLGLANVQLALRRTGTGTSTCEWFNGRKLANVPCVQVQLLPATLRDFDWNYTISSRASLPKGSYLLYATAVNRAGVAQTAFSAANGNVVSFRMR
jgi:hypothetical protein